MSNIHKTNVNKIKQEVHDLLNDIKTDPQEDYSRKYKHLYNTSKTLYNFIVKEHNTGKFNQTMLDQMLNRILKIQTNEISQNEASEEIGMSLAKIYIPQYQDKSIDKN